MSQRPSLQTHDDSFSVYLHGTSFRYEQAHPARSAGCTLNHLHPSAGRQRVVSHRQTWFKTIIQLPRESVRQRSGGHGTNYKQVNGLVPFEGVLAFCSEKVNVGLELQFEDVLLVNAVRLLGGADCVAQQGETGQREVIL